MPTLTLKGISDEVMDRLREMADRERHSLNQQAILLLERALAEQPTSFEDAYRRFRKARGRHRSSPAMWKSSVAPTRDVR